MIFCIAVELHTVEPVKLCLNVLTRKLTELFILKDFGPVPDYKGGGILSVLYMNNLSFALFFFEII